MESQPACAQSPAPPSSPRETDLSKISEFGLKNASGASFFGQLKAVSGINRYNPLSPCLRRLAHPPLSMKTSSVAVCALLLCFFGTPSFAGEKASSPEPVSDAVWLQSKGTLIFHDAFEREETGTGLRDIGNGWESATADRVPDVKQADLDGGILKVSSATEQAKHAAHIHHDAGFADGGVVVRFRFPELKKDQALQLGFVDRELKGVHAGHLCYGRLDPMLGRAFMMDHKTGGMNLEIQKRIKEFKSKNQPRPADFEALIQSKQTMVPYTGDTEWHELVLVTEGDELRLSIDGKWVVRHRSEGYAHPMKRWFSFLIPGTVWVDDVKIWKVN